jgi:hypothetical protein
MHLKFLLKYKAEPPHDWLPLHLPTNPPLLSSGVSSLITDEGNKMLVIELFLSNTGIVHYFWHETVKHVSQKIILNIGCSTTHSLQHFS